MKTRLLIEGQKKGLNVESYFRLVQRETNATGFSRTRYIVIAENYRSYLDARADFNTIKSGRLDGQRLPSRRSQAAYVFRYCW